jgi:hypothetical protein
MPRTKGCALRWAADAPGMSLIHSQKQQDQSRGQRQKPAPEREGVKKTGPTIKNMSQASQMVIFTEA